MELRIIKKLMKKLIVFIFTLFALSTNSQTSKYHSFPDSAAIWNIESFQSCGFFFDSWQYLYSIIISGDTVISGTSYHKLNVPLTIITSSGQCNVSGTSTNPGYYVGCIRQDTSIKKVFFIFPSDSVEQLLYDFNLAVGDTVKGLTGIYSADIVQSIDSVLVGGDYRKRWVINPCYGIYLIEGIGSTYGLIESSPGCITEDNDYTISCFKQNNITLYPDNTTYCDIINSAKKVFPKLFLVDISPNPFHTSALIDVSSEFEFIDLKIYNNLGILVYEVERSNKKSFLLNRNHFEVGVYFLQLIGNNGQISAKQFVVE